MTPNQILKKVRRNREMTIAGMSDVLGVSNQRISQWENGNPIPLERIREWANDERLPAWTCAMAHQMWLAIIQQDQARIGAQIADLQKQLATQAL